MIESDADLGDAFRVLVVDDHSGVRAGIVNLINAAFPDVCKIGTAASVDEAITQTVANQPDVVVLDADLAGEDGLALIPALQRAAPCEVVVLSSLVDSRVAAHALQLGAYACLHKVAPSSELIDCIAASKRARRHGDPARKAWSDGAAPATAGPSTTVLCRFLGNDDGVTAIEYGLLAALIVIACIAAFTATGASLEALYVIWSTAVIAALTI
jgi:DNA-binding NtrC family response regulator/Flp pilus assembly pilin Flp